MNLETKLKSDISYACSELFDFSIKSEEINLQPTRKEFEGNFTFVTFPYTRFSRKSPEETGAIIGSFLKEKSDIISDFNVVKGFLNLTISLDTWLQVFKSILCDEKFGFLPDRSQNIVIEYSSPNTNKPLHLGHLRNNFLGYSVAEVLKAAGYNVTKVNLVNDRGIHICKSMLAYQKFGNNETPISSGIKGDHLIGNYYVRFDKEYKKEIEALIQKGTPKEEAEKNAPIMVEAREMLQKWENNDSEVVGLWKKMNGWVYEGFDITYRKMGVNFDKTYHESETYLLGKDIVFEGLEKKFFYKKEDGSVWADLSNDGLDDKLLLRPDGTSVYMTQDLGTADLKYQDFKCDKSVYVVGNEQDHHFNVLFTILSKLERPYSNGLFHLSYGMVDLPSGKMKSREGTVVDADDLIDEMVDTARRHTEELGKIEGFTPEQADELYLTLALGALKYFLLKVDPKKRMLFNPEESIQFHGNTGPFIQYSYARISALLRKAEESGIDFMEIDLKEITSTHDTVVKIIQQLSNFPVILNEAASNNSPSLIAQFIYEIAKEFNRFYTEETIFGEKNENIQRFKLAFSFIVSKTIKHGMSLLGINVPERM